MTRPSEKALEVAEDLLDYVHPGMTRAAALQEVAHMVDQMNVELLESLDALLEELNQSKPGQHAVLVSHLKHIVADYKPWHAEAGDQHELFSTSTQTATPAGAAAGQMP